MKIVNGKIFNRLSMVAMVSLIFVAAMAAMALPTVKAIPIGEIYVDPPSQTVTVCTNFTVKINLIANLPTSNVGFNLTFDPILMECIGVTNDSFPPGITLAVVGLNNVAGCITMYIDATPQFTGSGTIADIEFHCKTAGTSFLNFTKAELDGIPIDPAFQYNGTCNQLRAAAATPQPPVGGEVLAIDALPLFIPWIAIAGAVVVATALVLASRRTFNH